MHFYYCSLLFLTRFFVSFLFFYKYFNRGGNTNVKFASTTQGQPEVIFQVESAPHPIYRRENDDLHLELEISSLEAKDGCKKIIKALDPTEKSIEIKIPPNLYSYEKQRKKQKQEKSSSSSSSSSSKSQYDNNIRIKNRGWPIRNNIQSSDIHPDLLYGDLIVEIKVLKKSSKKRGQRR
ncbi:MAG: DnaJ-class molecular chaperone [Bacillariaceae sp.]|jgi:DnaJ-class molecular chaperone